MVLRMLQRTSRAFAGFCYEFHEHVLLASASFNWLLLGSIWKPQIIICATPENIQEILTYEREDVLPSQANFFNPMCWAFIHKPQLTWFGSNGRYSRSWDTRKRLNSKNRELSSSRLTSVDCGPSVNSLDPARARPEHALD